MLKKSATVLGLELTENALDDLVDSLYLFFNELENVKDLRTKRVSDLHLKLRQARTQLLQRGIPEKLRIISH